MTKNVVLAVVAHSDDETIGIGGTIKRHVLNGDKVITMSMTDGVGSRFNNVKFNIQNRILASEKASDILGFSWVERCNFPDNEMDTSSTLEIVRCIESVKNKFNPSIVYLHSAGDLNIDHRVLSKAVLTAFRPIPNDSCKELRMFEVPSSTDFGDDNITGRFTPNLYVDISDTWLYKLAALKSYSEEMRDYPHSRSYEAIENLAKLRGNQVGLNMAEAFQIIRKIEY